MAINRDLWSRYFDAKSVPKLPCPQCTKGRVIISGAPKIVEPKFSKSNHSHTDFEFDWVVQRFHATLICDEANCGEIVNVIGDTTWIEIYVNEDDTYEGWTQEEVLHPRCMFPAPPMFPISKNVPYEIKTQLSLAFQLYWTDLSSSVARLRTSIELMLDHQKIPKTKQNKKGTKSIRLTLYDRIQLFENNATGADAADSLQALRNVGNLGTHGNAITEEAVMDTIDVLEDVLLGIYEKKSIKAKAAKLKKIQETE